MPVNGCDCSIVIKTKHYEKDMRPYGSRIEKNDILAAILPPVNVPYSEETLREAISLLQEEAAIEGDGTRQAIQKSGGVTGCVVTPLTIETVPLLFYLAMGSSGIPVFVSETRNLYRHKIYLFPMEDTSIFDLIQDRGSERRLFEACKITDFELRILREEAIKLRLDIYSERSPLAYPYNDVFEKEQGERFSGDCVTYKINGQEYKNIYGLTLATKKQGGTKTEIWFRRAKEYAKDLPQIIDEVIITAQLLRDKYEQRHFGLFRITLKNLVLVSDETNVNSTDTVIGSLRYYVAGAVNAEVFNSSGEIIE
jgi:hypothetical protein